MGEAELMADTFLCQKYNCRLTRQACANRQTAVKIYGIHKLPAYPGCHDCEQLSDPMLISSAANEAPKINTELEKPASNLVKKQEIETTNFTNTGEVVNMGSQKKVGVCTNCKRDGLKIAAGLCGSCQATVVGIHDAAERAERLAVAAGKFKDMPIKPRRRRADKPIKDKPAEIADRKVVETLHATSLQPVRLTSSEAQIIPITLRLTVEVNVRVMTDNSGA